MMKRFIIFILGAAALLAACGPAAPADDELMSIRLPMGFIPDPQYAPYYVAVEKGYFAEEGFEVDFVVENGTTIYEFSIAAPAADIYQS